MSNCSDCGERIAIGERISHQGKIVCGHCFIKMPAQESKLVLQQKPESIDVSKSILELMEIVINLDERIKELELRVGVVAT